MYASSPFVMTMSSDSNLSTHPNNQQADFVVSLAQEIVLDGSWSASLTQLIHPPPFSGGIPDTYVYYTLVIGMSTSLGRAPHDKVSELRLCTFNDKQLVEKYRIDVLGDFPEMTEIPNMIGQSRFYKPFRGAVKLSSRQFTSAKKLGDELSELIEADVTMRIQKRNIDMQILKPFSNPKVFYQSGVKGLKVDLVSNVGVLYAYVLDSPLIADLLGLHHKKITFKEYSLSPRDRIAKEHVETFIEPTFYALLNGKPKNLLTLENTMYLYVDVVDFQHVNNMRLPLLATIPIRPNCIYEPTRITPRSVNQSVISRMRVRICTSKSNLVPFFNDLPTVCTIRFERTDVPLYKMVPTHYVAAIVDDATSQPDKYADLENLGNVIMQ